MGVANSQPPSSESLLDTLTDDILIIIFSYLSLYERLGVLRVNKRWNRVLSSPHAWVHLDFLQEHQTDKNWETEENKEMRRYYMSVKNATSWRFPVDDKVVLNFLKKYTGGALNYLYLHVISAEIMAYVEQSYRNLKAISFLSPKGPSDWNTALVFPGLKPAKIYCYHNPGHSMPLIQSVKSCEFPLGTISCNTCIESQQSQVLTSIRKFANLRRLTITGIEPAHLTPDSLVMEGKDITELNFLKLPVAKRGCRGGYRGPNNSEQLCSALLPLLKLPNVSTFRISSEDPFVAGYHYNIDEFLLGMSDSWHLLRCLTMSGIELPSEGSFSSILTGLSQLQLYGRLAKDCNIGLIAKNLKKLTSLKLSDGYYTPSGIKSLCGHPSIKQLSLLQETQRKPDPEWLLAVYDVIISLPEITYIKLLGSRIIALHAQVEIPSISPNIQMDVENVREGFGGPFSKLPLD